MQANIPQCGDALVPCIVTVKNDNLQNIIFVPIIVVPHVWISGMKDGAPSENEV